MIRWSDDSNAYASSWRRFDSSDPVALISASPIGNNPALTMVAAGKIGVTASEPIFQHCYIPFDMFAHSTD